MSKIISFDSWNQYFKAPFGALKVNQGANIKVNVNEDIYSITLVITKEDATPDKKWTNIVATTQAKRKIREYFKNNKAK